MIFSSRICTLAAMSALCATAADSDLIEAGRRRFSALCAGCHGADGTGGERGPNLAQPRHERGRTQSDLREVIRHGIVNSGMPAFELPDLQLNQLAAFVHSLAIPAVEAQVAGDASAGEKFFFGAGKCSSCHMVAGRGAPIGPDLSQLGRERTIAQIERALRKPGSPAIPGYSVVDVYLRDGTKIRGLAKNESNFDLQVQDLDGKLHLLQHGEIARLDREEKSLMRPVRATETEFRDLVAWLSHLSGAGSAEAAAIPDGGGPSFHDVVRPREGEWPTYHGNITGNRFSPLRQIDTGNVAGLAPRWMFSIRDSRSLEVTPVVADGIMFVTTVNQAFALDAATGREIWHYERPRTNGLVGDASGGINRGVAVLGDRVFMVTDNAHLLALHRVTGSLLWDVEMADSRQNYGATSAPLVVHDLVISGTSGGDEGIRGFVAAYKASTGERVWRFWTIPAPGEPLAKTWIGKALEHGCTSAWLTGTYDAETDTLFWTTGNPCPDYNGDERAGDNLYSDSVVALDPGTGALRWFYQYTPHDLHDWDSAQTAMLVDAPFQGRPRRLLLHANRNGFFYVLDRTDGKLLRATPLVRRLTWATGIGADGRPMVVAGSDPTPSGVKVCPSVEGATNWMSNVFDPQTGLFYVMALEKCNIFSKAPAEWKPGESIYGGGTREIPDDPGQKVLRAIDLQTGKFAWEIPQIGTADSWGGVLATAGRLVFYCDDSGAFAAADAATGNVLWHFNTSQPWKASPMTYTAGGRQYVAVAAGSSILAFGLP